jgi:2-iminobutanoate/2-iminopropanoate deaminase
MSTPIGPYTPLVRAGQWLISSGQIGLNDGRVAPGGVRDEVRQALENLAALLEAEGSGLHQVVKTTVFLRHMRDYPIVNEVWAEMFGDHRPARSAVAVAELPMHALVEVEAWAWTGDN